MIFSGISNNPDHRSHFLTAIILCNHLIGLIGLNLSITASLFEQITSLNLLSTFLFIVVCHDGDLRKLGVFSIIVFLLGLGVEILGVSTGLVFGQYHYTPALGFQMLGVPLIIGLNWVLLTYCAGSVSMFLLKRPILRVLVASLIMVGIDVLLESFAIRHHLWIWDGSSTPPLRNFLAWGVIGWFTQMAFVRLVQVNTTNKPALGYIFILLVFLFADKISAHL